MALNANIIKTFEDPVIWCESYLRDPKNREKPLSLRSYQKEVLRNTRKYKNMISRWGRRCIVGDSPIQMFDGSIKYIKDIKIGDTVVSQDKYGIIKPGQVIDSFSNGILDVYQIYLNDGRVVKCTEEHELLTYSLNDNHRREKKYLSINNGLKKGDKIVILKQYETYGTYNNIEEAKLLGYLLSDGHIVETQTPKFTGNNYLYIDEVQNICKKIFDYNCVITERTESKAYDIHLTDSNKQTTNKVKDWLRNINLLGKKEKFKNIFKLLSSFDKESLGYFLNRLWSGDGCITLWNAKDRPYGMRIESALSSGNLEFIKELQTFLYKFCISAKIKKDERICKMTGKMTLNYKLYFSDRESIENFLHLTGPIYGKEIQSNKALEELKNRRFKRIRNGRENFRSVTIKKIEYLGKEEVFDISVLNHNNYITNGIVSHNCGKSVTFCADCLWWAQAWPLIRMIQNKDSKIKPFRILIFCPYESQVKELWNTFAQLIGDSPLLMDQVEKIRTSDIHSIQFKGPDNDTKGSTIEGYTIGISSANQGTSLRGLSGDMIFIDEMDYIPGDIIEQVILPIRTTHIDVRFRVCSTPSGKREQFFSWCSEASDIGWFHSHIPSWHPDNDNWMSIEKAKSLGLPIEDCSEFQVKHTTSSSNFDREYGAEFGEEFGGVYKHHLINKCLFKYARNINITDSDVFDPGFLQNPEHKYIIGVDWNSYINGGQIVMVEYCSTPTYSQYFDDEKQQDVTIDFTGKYRIFYRIGIKSQKATQRLTRQEIIRLLSVYKVDYLYVDYGAGDTNIEELTLFGEANPAYEIARKLVVVDSGAVVEHFDHILGKPVKKRNKTLMVNFSAINLEEGMMILPKEEDQTTRLIGQMRGYTIKNITSRGEFSYEGEDHILDAFNLAIYGFQQKFGKLLGSRVTYNINSFSDPRTSLYPTRNYAINTSIPIRSNNTYSTPTRDPEYARQGFKSGRQQIPGFGRSNFNIRRGSF